MDLGLAGKVAIVTGVSRGICWSTAHLVLAEGAHVVGVSRTTPDREIEGLHHVQADILDPSTPRRLVDLALSELGAVDVLINNAAAGAIRAGYETVRDEQWRETWELVFLSVIRMTSAALPALLEGGAGTIVNLSSRNARVPVRAAPDYSAAKAGLNNYSKGLAAQYAAHGLRVLTVSPGPTATPLWLGPEGAAAQHAALEGGQAKAIVSRAEAAMPHRRFVKPEEVADLIAYLASGRPGSISGVDILIDAGLTQTL